MTKSLYSQRHRALAAAIADQRKAKGMTQAEVARAMGSTRHQPFIANIEAGERRIDVVELLRLADIIGLDAEALIRHLKTVPDE
jgi:transcriptional regulator with XRE-family HTH domain